jgi:hypothetical protein
MAQQRASRFGPAVIGEAAFQAEDLVRRNPVQKYGPSVVSAEEAAAEAAKAAARTTKKKRTPPPAVPGKLPDGSPDPTADEAAGELEKGSDALRQQLAARQAARKEEAEAKKHTVEGQSIEEVKAALDANPALVDPYLAAERERKPAPRKGVLAALIAAEQRQESPRQELIDELAALLTPAS